MVRIGCVQFAPIFCDVASNLEKIEEFILNTDADFLIFPELALTGYFFTSASDAKKYGEPINGPHIQQIKRIAKDTKTAIALGFLESDNEVLYNSAVAIDCNGVVAGHYRKVHLFYYEKIAFTRGNLGFSVFDLELRNGELIKVGLEICYDWRFPEASRTLAIKGAEIIAIPSNIVSTTGMLINTLRVRAFENRVIIAFADRIGAEKSIVDGKNEELIFRGQSAIINYNGEILAEDSSRNESITYADVLTENTRSKNINKFNNIINDRQNDIYFK